MKKKLIIIVLFVLFFLSCQDNDSDGNAYGKRNFWASDITNNSFYSLGARLLAQNSRCEVWVENGCGVDAATAQTVANEYSNFVYPAIMNAFGWHDNNYDVMRYADLLGDENRKLIILLLDIRDGYTEGNGYVAGYFDPINFFSVSTASSQGKRSNECDMIYLDTNPSEVGSRDFYETLAHEMQHMMNFVTSSLFKANNLRQEYYMDTWIDEGLSSAAEWVYSGEQNKSRIGWFNADETGLISRGDNFFLWDNNEDVPNAVLNDYSTVYLFFQWLRIQNDISIYGKILISEYSDHRAVVDASGYNSWNSLLQTWLAANYIGSSTGKFGYRSYSTFNNLTHHYAPANSAKIITLNPGEGVYSPNVTIPSPTGGSNINYAYLYNNEVSETYKLNSTLLTYNSSTNINGSGEDGYITGIPPSPSANISSVPSISGPYKVGAGDILSRRGIDRDVSKNFSSMININS
ncbi:MAG: hypothetical protein LBG94_10240, partial [Treponema sp.]|nr:hypothetical protein [Treponema sp.]